MSELERLALALGMTRDQLEEAMDIQARNMMVRMAKETKLLPPLPRGTVVYLPKLESGGNKQDGV